MWCSMPFFCLYFNSSAKSNVSKILPSLGKERFDKAKQNTANNGEIVVALIGEEATVKTFYKEKDHIRLQPENSTMDPIIVPNCEILGKVSGVFRKIK